MFAYHNPSAHLIASLTESVKRVQTVFGHLKVSISLFYTETWGVVTQSPEPGAHVKNARLKKNEKHTFYIVNIRKRESKSKRH